jgi:hypothetical protein
MKPSWGYARCLGELKSLEIHFLLQKYPLYFQTALKFIRYCFMDRFTS